MAPIINTDDPRATKLLDVAGIEYTLGSGSQNSEIPVDDYIV